MLEETGMGIVGLTEKLEDARTQTVAMELYIKLQRAPSVSFAVLLRVYLPHD